MQRIEYPEARKAGKEIVSVDMEGVGDERLKTEFADDAPDCIDGKQEKVFQEELLRTVRRLGLARDEHNLTHNFLLGLAYLNGIDVEVDRCKALELITSAAESELPEAMKKLAEMYEDAIGVERDYQVVLKWEKQLADYYTREYGEEHPDTLITLGNLAFAYGKTSDYQKEVELEEKVYDLKCKVLGEEHPSTLIALNNLAATYRNLGDNKKALDLLQKLYPISCRVNGKDAPLTQKTFHRLIEVREALA